MLAAGVEASLDRRVPSTTEPLDPRTVTEKAPVLAKLVRQTELEAGKSNVTVSEELLNHKREVTARERPTLIPWTDKLLMLVWEIHLVLFEGDPASRICQVEPNSANFLAKMVVLRDPVGCEFVLKQELCETASWVTAIVVVPMANATTVVEKERRLI